MADARYMDGSINRHPHPHHHQESIISGCMPVTCSSEQPAALVYPAQDLAPYSTVSSFNYPATADSSLLTPVSHAASPPLSQRSHPKGMQYTSHSSVSASQQPTPPSTSGLYFHPYDIHSSSQSSSPMTINPHAMEARFGVASYMVHSPHPSPKDEVPPPAQQYLGHYTVSNSCNESEVANSFSGGDYSEYTEVNGNFLSQDMVVASAAHGQLLTPPHQPPMRTGMIPRTDVLEGQQELENFAHGIPSQSSLRPCTPLANRNRKTPRKQKPSMQRRLPRAKSRQKGRPGSQSTEQDNGDDAAGSQPDNTHWPPLKLSDKTPAEDKYLFGLRQKYIGGKGKGMWDDIATEYATKYQRMAKATLQMKVSRAVAKYGEWPEHEVEALERAVKEDEETRYERLLGLMKKNGGGKSWEWKPQHIEAKLVALGFEEPDLERRGDICRRKRTIQCRRPDQPGHQDLSVGAAWPPGLNPPSNLYMPQGYYPGYQASFHSVMGSEDGMVAQGQRPEQDDKILDQIFHTTLEQDAEDEEAIKAEPL